eukprot:gene15567-biopygen3691
MLSGLFLEGEGSALGLFVGYLVFVGFVWYVLNGIWFLKDADKKREPEKRLARSEDGAGTVGVSITSRLGEERHQLPGEDKKTRLMIYALAGFINLIVMLLVDFLYVYIVISYDTTIITISVMMLALGKIIWNSYSMWNGLRAIVPSGGASMDILTFFSDANDVTSHSILFHKHRYVVRFNSYLLTMVIYGAVFPPVALIGLVSIVTRTWFEEVMFGHLLELSKKREHLKDEIERKLSTDCGELLESMDSLLYIVLPIPMLIYSYLVFDTFGQDTSVAIADLDISSNQFTGDLPASLPLSLQVFSAS